MSIATGVVGVLLAACGNGSANSVERGPTPLPSGSESDASVSLCRTYFGSAAAVAREFGVATLQQVPFWEFQVGRHHSSDGTIMCKYLRPGTTGDALVLTLTTHLDIPSPGPFAEAKAGAMYAYAFTNNPNIHGTQTNQRWLQKVAATTKTPELRGIRECRGCCDRVPNAARVGSTALTCASVG